MVKQYSKLRVGIQDHLKDIKGMPFTIFGVMILNCDKCGVFHQSQEDIAETLKIDRTSVSRALARLENKKFIKELARLGKTPIYWIIRYDHRVEAMVKIKGYSYLVDNSTIIKNLGVKHRALMHDIVR